MASDFLKLGTAYLNLYVYIDVECLKIGVFLGYRLTLDRICVGNWSKWYWDLRYSYHHIQGWHLQTETFTRWWFRTCSISTPVSCISFKWVGSTTNCAYRHPFRDSPHFPASSWGAEAAHAVGQKAEVTWCISIKEQLINPINTGWCISWSAKWIKGWPFHATSPTQWLLPQIGRNEWRPFERRALKLHTVRRSSFIMVPRWTGRLGKRWGRKLQKKMQGRLIVSFLGGLS